MSEVVSKMKRIAILTSGGDAPGMNAATVLLYGKQSMKDLKFTVLTMAF